MKSIKFLLLIVLLLSVQTLSFATSEDEGIKFFKGTWKEVLAEAKKQNKLVFIDAYATWCGPCKYMAKNVFVQEEVAKFYNESFIPYKIDVDKEEGGKVFAQYGGQAMPTFFFVDSSEKLVYKKVGGMDAEDFIQTGKDALIVPNLKKQYESGDRSPEFTKKYIAAMAGTGDEAAEKLVEDYFKTLENKDLLKKENFKLMQDYPRAYASREFQYFLNNVDKFEEAFGKESLVLIEGILDELFTSAVESKDKSKIDDMANLLDKVKNILPENVNVEEVKQKMYDSYELQIKK